MQQPYADDKRCFTYCGNGLCTCGRKELMTRAIGPNWRNWLVPVALGPMAKEVGYLRVLAQSAAQAEAVVRDARKLEGRREPDVWLPRPPSPEDVATMEEDAQ